MKKQKIRIKTAPNVDDHRKRIKDHDLRISTWNVRTLYRVGAMTQLMDVLHKYKCDVTAIQEVRWIGHGVTKTPKGDIYYSCHESRHEFGCGFVIGKKIRNLVSRFTPINERIATIRLKAKYFHLSLICAHAPTEEKDDDVKEAFYDQLEEVYDSCPSHDVKIILGDFNAKIGRESCFEPTVGKFSLHNVTTDNGMRLISFAAARNMVLSSTRFPHRDIHKATWVSPDQMTKNQIDHVVVDGRHSSSVLDVRSIRGANMDSDHFLVAAKVRTRLSVARNVKAETQRKFDVAKLRSQQIANDYSQRTAHLLRENFPATGDICTQWKHIESSMKTAGKSVLGFQTALRKNSWYDEECRKATAEKNAAYKATLQSVVTRRALERYREKKREEKRLFRRKKKEMERRDFEQMEMFRSQNEVRKFYQKVKHQSEGFGSCVFSCKDNQGNLVTDTESVLKVWKEHFYNLLVSTDSDQDDTPEDINDDGVICLPPDEDDVKKAITRLKNNKAAGADGLPAELFKAGGDELLRCMSQLIKSIWLEERMPVDWSLSVLCPVHKKGDKTVCANYRGISLLSIAYKILSSILCEKLKPKVNAIIGSYQCGFRPGKSTTDQIFTLRQILEKTQEMQIDTYHLFVDYKAAFDSPIRMKLFKAMSEFGIPTKLIRLCMMTLTETTSSVKIGKNLSEPFMTKRGFRQGDSLSCDLFNLLLEKILRNAAVNTTGTIFNKKHMLLAYADDIDIMGRTLREVTAIFSSIERESAKMGLVVNESKTKLMISTSRQSTRIGPHVDVDRYSFEVVKEFVYLGTAVNTCNDISFEIKRRTILANRCYFGLSKQLRNKTLSIRTKIALYKTLILPVLLYGAESWVLAQADEAILGVFERKILRKIYGPICVNGEYRHRMNHELYELYADINIVKRIKQQRLRWLGHVVRMDEDTPTKKVFENYPEGTRKRGRPKLRWKDQIEENLSKIGLRNWRTCAQDRSAWNSKICSAFDLNRL